MLPEQEAVAPARPPLQLPVTSAMQIKRLSAPEYWKGVSRVNTTSCKLSTPLAIVAVATISLEEILSQSELLANEDLSTSFM